MHDYSYLRIRMKARFAQAKTFAEKQQIVDNFVKELRANGLSNEEIIKISEIKRLKIAQDSREMISNNDAYKKALEKALGKKINFIKKSSKKH